jgi:pilus assembly protein Flp/PilA
LIQRFWQEEDGQTLLEYGFLISLIAFVVIFAIGYFGRKVTNTYSVSSNQMTN